MDIFKRFTDTIINIPWAAAVCSVLGFLLLWHIAPFINIGWMHEQIMEFFCGDTPAFIAVAAVTMLVAGISMFFQYALMYKIVQQNFKLWQYGLLIIISLIGMACVILAIHHHIKMWPDNFSYMQQLKAVAENIGMLNNPYMGVYSIFIIILASSAGCLLSNIVREKNLLVPIMLCCAIIDLWTVYAGFVSKVADKAPAVLGAVSSSLPSVGTGSFHILSTIGAGDFIFPAVVFACVFRFNFSPRRNFWVMFGLLFAAMLVILLGVLQKLPALVPVCLAAILSNFKEFSLSLKEWGYIAIVLGILIAVLFLFSRFSA